jgi:hypothetical protein
VHFKILLGKASFPKFAKAKGKRKYEINTAQEAGCFLGDSAL